MTCEQTTSLGAYVLGALDAPDRQETERHLRDCSVCRDELVQLSPLPGLLGQVSMADLAALEADALPDAAPARPTPIDRRPSGRWPRTRRVLVTAVAAAAVGLGVVLAGRVVVDPSTTATSPSATWSTAEDVGGIQAEAVLSDRGWGTDITLTMDGLPAQQRCRLVVRSVDGRTETAGWWTTGYASSAEVPASTSIDSAAVARLEVVNSDGQVLAVLTPDTA